MIHYVLTVWLASYWLVAGYADEFRENSGQAEQNFCIIFGIWNRDLMWAISWAKINWIPHFVYLESFIWFAYLFSNKAMCSFSGLRISFGFFLICPKTKVQHIAFHAHATKDKSSACHHRFLSGCATDQAHIGIHGKIHLYHQWGFGCEFQASLLSVDEICYVGTCPIITNKSVLLPSVKLLPCVCGLGFCSTCSSYQTLWGFIFLDWISMHCTFNHTGQ